MTKLEIYRLEENNEGKVYLFPEGLFYKAYEKSAFLLCKLVHPFKVSIRSYKGIKDSIASIGFPKSSLEKFSSKLEQDISTLPPQPGGVVLFIKEKPDCSGFCEWKERQSAVLADYNSSLRYNNLPVYGKAYQLLLEITVLCSCLDRRFRYSLGEDRLENIKQSRRALAEVQLCLRLLNDLKVITDKRYVPFMVITDDISEQLSKWDRFCRQKESAGVSPP